MRRKKSDYIDAEKRRKELQGEKSRLVGSEKEMHIAFLIQRRSLTNKELKEEIKLSSPALAKHLKNLLELGFIYKDTVKPNETEDPRRVGKIVYRMSPSQIEVFARHIAGMGMIPDLSLPEGMKRKLEEHYDAIAKIWSSYMKSFAEASKKAEEEIERLDEEYAKKERG